MAKHYKGDEYLEKATQRKQDVFSELDESSATYEMEKQEAVAKARIQLKEMLSNYLQPDTGLIDALAAHVESEYESIASEDGIRLAAAYVNLLNGEYDEEATPSPHRPRVDFVESLVQEHADVLDDSTVTYLKSYLGRMKGVS
jgi:hypothetical protein